MDDEPGWVTIIVGHCGQQVVYFGWGGTLADGGRAFGAEGIHWPEFLFEDSAVKEEDGVEGLVLSRSGHAGNGQAGQKGFDFHFRREQFEFGVLEKRAVADKPVDVGFFGVDREVLERTNLSH